jgi:hypothetical protein
MTVRSPKTAHHEGQGVRVVPIAPELRPILQALFDQAPEGSEAVVPRLTDPDHEPAHHVHEADRPRGLRALI